MSNRIKNRTLGRQPSRLHQTINGLVLASALVVSSSAMADNSGTKRNYHISSGSLSHALSEFAGSAGILLSADARLTDGKTSKGLDGEYTVEEGFRKLLSGTGLVHIFTNDNTVTLKVLENQSQSDAATLSAVQVVGKTQFSYFNGEDPNNTDYSRSNAYSATKTDTPLMQTPMSVKVIPQQVLKDQQDITLAQALRNVSGVIPNEGSGGGNFFMRGFQNYNVYKDGFLNQSQWFHTEDLANVERIEVLKGPASILYGRSEPGGLVNFVTKQPLDTPYYSLRQQFGSFDLYRTDIDATGPLTQNKDLAYRFNLGYQSNNSFQDFAGNERIFVAPSVRWNINSKTTSTLKLEYSDIKETGRADIPLQGNRPAAIPRSRNLGEPWNIQEDKYLMLSLNTEHAFNDSWKLRHRFNFTNYELTMSSFNVDGWWSPVQANGNQTRYYFAQNMDGNDYQHNFFNALELIGKFKTGFAKHTLLVGGDYYRSDVRTTTVGFGANPNQYDTINVYNPTHGAGQPAISAADITTANTTLPWFGLYAQDQVELPYHFHVMGGLRYDAAEYDSTAYGEYAHDRLYQNEDRVSPRGGVVWQPIPELSLYGSYTENFGASNTNLQGIPLPPQTAEQWETGIKTELFDGRFIGTVAYFDLTKQHVPIAVRPGVTEAAGEQESRGIELDFSGQILPGWNVIAAYAYTPFAKTIKDGFRATNLGKRLNNAPENSGSLWTTYQFQTDSLRDLKLGAGVQAVGQRQIGFNEIAQAPGYATVNLMASQLWKVGKSRITAQLNVDNLLDKTYTGSIFSYGPSYYGAPRTFMGSVKVEY
ncbi:TonB-dependent receptor [Methylomonas sp. UP202]|uniref:TonB-dependent siderophore receptor n=1 Tax=Methylomonas sp. UP202 TaxID=3040943 RepID=UPI00247AF343|nr:TonB-dependent receptor [Methylomonas sp. UP202]WGS85479.1 TonB-dependent receptor [Methylomonas sp. UP202]